MYQVNTETARAAVMFAVIALGSAPAAAITLSNGPGDGTVSVGVDAFGSFGNGLFVGAPPPGVHDADYDPVGGTGPTGTVFQSGIAIGVGGSRTFMSSGTIGGNGGGTVGSPVIGGGISAASAFTFGGLSVTLTQSLTALFTGGSRTGTVLVQKYALTNASGGALGFDVYRYLDADLLFDNDTSADGGGRIVQDGIEVLFATDTATNAVDPVTSVGIAALGGALPAAGRHEVDAWSVVRDHIRDGGALDDTVANDADANGIVDAGNGLDMTMGLRNSFALADGETAIYTTLIIFGNGETSLWDAIPGPAPLSTLVAGLVGMGLLRRKRRI
jgi:hypothetical protein